MLPRTLRTALVAAALLPAAAAAQAAPDEAALLQLGRNATVWLILGQADSLLAHMTPETREKVGGADGILRQRDMLAARAGSEVKLLEEKMNRRMGNAQYWRESEFDQFTAEPIVIRWLFDEQGMIVGAGMGPKSGTPAPD